jgi:putative transposase
MIAEAIFTRDDTNFLVDGDSYLQEVSRYIHLNPIRVSVRSAMTLGEKRRYLRNYRWSSYGGYLSEKERKGFLKIGEILGYFGGERTRGRKKYEGFVREGMTGEVTNPLEKGKGHGIIGGNEFIEKVRERYIGLVRESRELPAVKRIVAEVEPERILGAVGHVFRVPREELLRRGYKGVARGVLMEMLYQYGGMNQREIGELLG